MLRAKALRLQWESNPPGNCSLHPVAVGVVEEVTNSLKQGSPANGQATRE